MAVPGWVSAEWWPSFPSHSRPWPDNRGADEADVKARKDKEDAKHLASLQKQLRREEVRLSSLKDQAAKFCTSNITNACVLGGNPRGPVDKMQFGVVVMDEQYPVKTPSQVMAGKAATALSECYHAIERIKREIEALRASQEAE